MPIEGSEQVLLGGEVLRKIVTEVVDQLLQDIRTSIHTQQQNLQSSFSSLHLVHNGAFESKFVQYCKFCLFIVLTDKRKCCDELFNRGFNLNCDLLKAIDVIVISLRGPLILLKPKSFQIDS